MSHQVWTYVIIWPSNTVLISPIKFFILISHRIVRNSIILTNLKEFFIGVRIVSRVKTSFVWQWNLQSLQNSSHMIIHMKPIQSPKCMIKIFRGAGGGGWERGSSERCLKWGGGGWGSLRDLCKNI